MNIVMSSEGAHTRTHTTNLAVREQLLTEGKQSEVQWRVALLRGSERKERRGGEERRKEREKGRERGRGSSGGCRAGKLSREQVRVIG